MIRSQALKAIRWRLFQVTATDFRSLPLKKKTSIVNPRCHAAPVCAPNSKGSPVAFGTRMIHSMCAPYMHDHCMGSIEFRHTPLRNRRGFRKPHTIFWYIGATSKETEEIWLLLFQRSDEIWKHSFVVCGLASLFNFSCLGAPGGLEKFGWSGPLVFRVCLSLPLPVLLFSLCKRSVQAKCKLSRVEAHFLHKFGERGRLVFRVCLSTSSRPLSPPLSFELLLPFLYTPFTGL